MKWMMIAAMAVFFADFTHAQVSVEEAKARLASRNTATTQTALVEVDRLRKEVAQLKAENAALKKELEAAKNVAILQPSKNEKNDAAPTVPFANPLKVGMVGAIGSYKIVSVFSDSEALATITTSEIVTVPNPHPRTENLYGRTGSTKDFKVDNTIKERRETPHVVWMSGIDTTNRADGDVVQVTGSFKIVGTKRYETTNGGASQVLEVRPDK